MNKNERIIRWVTLFENLSAVELVKSPGMIPFHVAKLGGNRVSVTLVGFARSAFYPEASRISDRVALRLIEPKSFTTRFALYRYLLTESRSIDILHLYHFRLPTLLKAILYKLIHRQGLIYLKLDADPTVRRYFGRKRRFDPGYLIRYAIRRGLTYLATWISIETPRMLDDLVCWGDRDLRKKLFLNPYGLDVSSLDALSIRDNPKENIIVTVSRLGTYQKNTPFLLDVLKRVLPSSGWRAYLIGPVDEPFMPVFDRFLVENAELRGSIVLLGNMDDRKSLMDILNRSKIFCLTSRYESWGIVLSEAQYFGCYVASTDVGCARKVVDDGTFGFIAQADVESFASELRLAMSQVRDWEAFRLKCRDRVRRDFSWDLVAKNLLSHLGILEIEQRRLP